MDINIAKEVIDCLPKGRTKFRYFKDRYAAYILSQVIENGRAISDLKQSKYAGLLNKQIIKDLIAQSGDGVLRQTDLDLIWQDSTEDFLLTLAIWGDEQRSWDQVSRAGHNLVLQLNFSNEHNRLFHDLLKPDNEHCFTYFDHPVMKLGEREMFRETLAWSRIDIGFDSNEALIEELQTDWLRIAKWMLARLEKGQNRAYTYCTDTTPENMKLYIETVLSRYGKIWDEAILTASISFIRNELGIDRIYIHTPDTGAAVKKIKYRQPPRSLYSALPRKFCFKQTTKAPEFLAQNRAFKKLERKLGGTQWNYLDLQTL